MWMSGRGRRRRRRRLRHRPLHLAYGRHTNINGQLENSDIDSQTHTITTNRSSDASLKYLIIAGSALLAFIAPPVTGSSSSSSWQSSTGMGRNIRQLPCVSRRSGETGVCMFAYNCAKENGTHLGTCIDRFYFGSCCKLADPDAHINLVDAISHNQLNKDDTASSGSSTMKTAYQRPSSSLPHSSFGTSSTIALPLPVSISSVSHPPSSVSSPSSSTSDFITTMFSKPVTHTTSYDALPITSRTPSVNVTFSYSTPAVPLVYATSVSTAFPTATVPHQPVATFPTSNYSKPATKPTSKPSKPKPTGKPGSPKPKPTKPASRPTLITQASFASSTETPSPFFNQSTLPSSYQTLFNSRPATYTTQATAPVRPFGKPSTPAIPTPITLFTSSRKPTKPPRPSTEYTTTPLPSSYVKIPSVASSTPTQGRPSQQTAVTSSTTYVSTTFGPSSSVNFEQNSKINNTVDHQEAGETKKPSSPWTSPQSTYSTRPWTMPQSSTSTPSQPALVTWTTMEEVPGGLILPDRTKPTTVIRPTGIPPVTKPASIPTYPRPLASSTGRPTSSKPTSQKPDNEETHRPSTPPSSSSTLGGSSSGWVEVSVTTHAPASSYPTPSSVDSSVANTVTVNTQSSFRPGTTVTMTTSVTKPMTNPVPVETTQAPSIETNEIDATAINMSDYKQVCGRRFIQTARIVGGAKSTFGKWPWQISLRQWRTSTYLHKCGAALFNENWAVTAAHCVENVPPGDLLLRLGEHDLSVEDEPYSYQERRVQIVASHPQFDPRTFEYDLALLRFYEPVKFQPNIIPVCVPEDNTNFVGGEATVTGWGRLYEDGPLPSVLQEVSVPVINNSVCESMYQSAGYIEHIPSIFICAGWRKGGFDSCEGDSGGPMVIQRPDHRYQLAGVISWGIGCAEPNQPGVYTRISEFRDWINQILQF